MPDARSNDPRDYGDMDRGGERARTYDDQERDDHDLRDALIRHVWERRRAEAKDRTAGQEKRVKVIQQKLDRLDEAFSK